MAVSRPSKLNITGDDKIRDLSEHASGASPVESIEPLMLIGID